MLKIFVILVHYLNQDITEKCLNSLNHLNKHNLIVEVVIVNNNPKEDLIKLKQKYFKYTFLDSRENLGFAEGNNIGIRKALGNGANYILILNNDTIIDQNLIIDLIEPFKLDKMIGAVSPKIYFAPGYEYHINRYQKNELGKVIWYAGGIFDWQNVLGSHRGVDKVDKGQYDTQMETDFITGCAVMIKKEVINKVGFFDASLFMYLEDIDLSQRIKNSGYKIIFCPKGRLWHFNSGSSTVGSNLQDYFITRNRLVVGMRYASFRTKLALIKESVKLFFTGRQWQRIGVKDYFLNLKGIGSWKG